MQVVNRRYQIDELIGSGGMGTVYRAFDRLNNEFVALKSITVSTDTLDFNSKPTGNLDDENASHIALIHEFRTLSSLHHPNVINVLDYGFAMFHPMGSRQPFFTMELLKQPKTLLEAGANLPLEGKIDLVAQTVDALAYLHRRGVVHRDLKPENVLVVDGRVFVVDFGLASRRGDWFAAEAGIAGTPRYLAPEVLLGGESSPAADFYAIGVMLYELLSGTHPFLRPGISGFDFVRATLNKPPNLELLAEYPPELVNLIGRLLEKTGAARAVNPNTLRDELFRACNLPERLESISVRDSFLNAASFVGREREFARLRDALQMGNSPFWLISGESGVGKSRLMDEIRTFALVNRIAVVRGTAAAEAGNPYQVWIAPLRQLVLSLTDLQTDEAGVLTVLIPDIEALTGVSPRRIPDFDAGRLFDVMFEVLRRQPEPTLIILEDIHWAGEGLTALNALVQRLDETPVRIFCTFRNDEAPELLLRFSNAMDLRLQRLPRPAIEELCEAMLGNSGTEPDVVTLVERETEGNVYFMVETMRALAEEAGRLDLVGTKTLPDHVFAGGMRQIIARRIERVPAARALLDLASVAGRALDVAVLEHINGASIEPLLIASANAAVLEFHVGDGWRFAHDKLREYLLSIQPADSLPTLHRQIAAGIEAVYPNDMTKAADLARHWGAAGDQEKELQYLPIAAHQTFDLGDLAASRRFFERIYALTEKPGLLLDTLIHLGRIRGEKARDRSEADEAERLLLQAREIAIMLNHVDAELLAMHHLLTNSIMYQEQDRWRPFYEQIRERYSQLSPKGQAGLILSDAYFAYLFNQFEDGILLCRIGLSMTLRMGDLWTSTIAIRLIGWLLLAIKQYDDAERFMLTALKMARRLGKAFVTATTLAAVGFMYMLRRQWSQAFAHFDESLLMAERVQHWRQFIIVMGYIACARWLRSEYAEMAAILDQIDARFAQVNQPRADIENVLHWALIVRQTGGEERAHALYQLNAYRNSPRYRWGEREAAAVIIRELEREGAFAGLETLPA